jgi:hypothetical protein
VAALAALATATAAACSKRAAPKPTASTAIAPVDVEPATSARRPARRYYMTHTPDGCEIYFVDPTALSPPLEAPCPASINVGERIRIAGKTCIREGDDPARVEPVVCPDPLTNLERKERGELPGQAPNPTRDAGAE